MTKSTELAVPSKAQLEAVYEAITDGKPLPNAADPEQVSRAILERIMAAETFEEAFAPQAKIPAWRDRFLDKPVRVTDVHFNRSTIEGGQSAVYAVVDLVDSDGVQETVTCGGRNVLVQLLKMLEKGWTDQTVMLTSKKTSEGYTVLWLEAAGLPF